MTYQISIRTRLTLCFAIALAGGLSLFAFGIWFSMKASLMSDLNATLIDRAHSLESFLDHELSEVPKTRLHEELDEFSSGLPLGIWIQVSETVGNPIYASPLIAGKHLRRHTETVVIRNVAYEIRVTGSTESINATLYRLRVLLLASIPVVILIATFGGFWLSRRALKPVDAITNAAQKLSLQNLSERLAVGQTGDELQRLSETWNGMLDRLETAVSSLSQFTADASHELRTPLAVIRATAELAARRSRSPEAYRASFQEIVAETDRMTQLVEDLLFLARWDARAPEIPQMALELDMIVKEACGMLAPLAAEKSIKFSMLVDTSVVTGNAPAIRRLVLVLLDNAIKFSAPNSEVEIVLMDCRLSVRDHGIGIAQEALPHIFERFYQADSARAQYGYGLGLAQAQSIAQRHQANIRVFSEPGSGATFEVLFKPVAVSEVAALLLPQ